jgi:hypothetical protein
MGDWSECRTFLSKGKATFVSGEFISMGYPFEFGFVRSPLRRAVGMEHRASIDMLEMHSLHFYMFVVNYATCGASPVG